MHCHVDPEPFPLADAPRRWLRGCFREWPAPVLCERAGAGVGVRVV